MGCAWRWMCAMHRRQYNTIVKFSVKCFSRDLIFSFSFPSVSVRSRRIPFPSKRGKIKTFSWRSSRRLRFLVRNTADMWRVFLTLTWPGDFPISGVEVKRQLNSFLQYLRRVGVKYIWVLEFQDRGAPHIHMFLSGRVSIPEVSRRWYEIVGSGDIRHLQAGTSVRSVSSGEVLGYVCSYVRKMKQKTVPDGFRDVGRFWGVSSGILECVRLVFSGSYSHICRDLRMFRRWYRSHLRAMGISWRWQGLGFLAYDGMEFFSFAWWHRLKIG